MKHRFKRFFSCLLALCFIFALTSFCVVASAENSPAVMYGDLYNGCELYRSSSAHYSGNTEIAYYYSDGYFRDASAEYNSHLASMSMVLAMGSMTMQAPVSENTFVNIGMKNINVSVSENTSAVIGSKTLFNGESDECTLIAVSVMGENTTSEWVKSAYIGTEGNALNMQTAADELVAAVNKYISDNGISAEKLKLWLIGYGRGGCIVDLAGKTFTDTYGSANVYGYAFDALKGALVSSAGTYANLHTVNNYNSPLTFLMPEYMGFNCYGSVYYIGKDTDNALYTEQESAMVKQLNMINGSGSDYISTTTFTWAKLNLDISISNISDLINGEFDLYTDIDTSHSQGNSLRDFLTVFSQRIAQKAITNRAAYTTTIPSDVKSAASEIGVTTCTLQDAVPQIVALALSLDKTETDRLTDNFSNFPVANYALKAIRLLNFIKNMEYSWGRDYSDIVGEAWDMLDTSKSDYVKISEILTSEQTATLKKLLPILLYTVAEYTSVDYGKDKQTMGAIAYNMDLITQMLKPEISLAWLRTEDTYYGTEYGAVPVSAADAVELKISAGEDTVLADAVVSILSSDGTVITTLNGATLTSDNISALGGNITVIANTSGISVVLPKTAGYKLCITSSATDESPDTYGISERAVNGINTNSESFILYSQQSVLAAYNSLDVRKTVAITTVNASYKYADDGKSVTFTGLLPQTYTSYKWTVNGVDNEETSSSLTLNIDGTTENINVVFDVNTEIEYGAWTSNDDGTHTRVCTTDASISQTESCCGGSSDCCHKAVCTVCAGEYGELGAHDWGEWSSNGNGTHTRACKNSAEHNETSNCSGGSADCCHKAVCTVCAGEYGELGAHDWGDWSSNGNGTHTRVCKNNEEHTETENETSLKKGDVNGDDNITLADAMMAFKYVAKTDTLLPEQFSRADCNSDTKVTLADAMAIFKYVAKVTDTVIF